MEKKSLNRISLLGKAWSQFFQSFFAIIGLLGTIYFSWKNIRLTEISNTENFATSKASINLTEKKLINENFQAMLTNLASTNFLNRVGAVSLLENIARNFPSDYYWPVVHTFSSYIKLHCNKNLVKQPCNSDDIQEIISFLSEGEHEVPHKMSDRVDISNTKLSNLDFSGGNFQFADFTGAIMTNISFSNTKMQEADFEGAVINNSDFSNSDISHANFSNSVLVNDDFFNSNLEFAQFGAAHFRTEDKWHNLLFMHSNLRNTDFCLAYSSKGKKVVFSSSCASGLSCTSFKLTKIYETSKLPNIFLNCKFKIESDPILEEARRAIKKYQLDGNLSQLYNSLPKTPLGERLIYRYH